MALDDTTSILDQVQEALEADGIITPQNNAEENPFKQGADDQDAQHKARSEIMAGAGGAHAEGSVAAPNAQAEKDKKEKENAKRRAADAMIQAAADFEIDPGLLAPILEGINNGLMNFFKENPESVGETYTELASIKTWADYERFNEKYGTTEEAQELQSLISDLEKANPDFTQQEILDAAVKQIVPQQVDDLAQRVVQNYAELRGGIENPTNEEIIGRLFTALSDPEDREAFAERVNGFVELQNDLETRINELEEMLEATPDKEELQAELAHMQEAAEQQAALSSLYIETARFVNRNFDTDKNNDVTIEDLVQNKELIDVYAKAGLTGFADLKILRDQIERLDGEIESATSIGQAMHLSGVKADLQSRLKEKEQLATEELGEKLSNITNGNNTALLTLFAEGTGMIPGKEETPKEFVERIQGQIAQNEALREELKNDITNLEEQISFLSGPYAPNDPDVAIAIDKAREQISEINSTIEQTVKLDTLHNEMLRFAHENGETLAGIQDNPSAILELALDDQKLITAYLDLSRDMDAETKKELLSSITGLQGAELDQTLETFLFMENEGQNFIYDAYDTINDVYEWGASWFSQPVEDTASQSDEVIAQQQEKIDALTEQKDAFMEEINTMDSESTLMNYYFGKVEELSVKISEMETQLTDYQEAVAALEETEQSLATIDEQLAETEAKIDTLYTGGMSTSPLLASSLPLITERFLNPESSGQFSPLVSDANMSSVDATLLQIKHAEFQANILEIEQTDALAAVASAAAEADRLTQEILGEETSTPAPAPDPAQLALDSNMDKINGLFSSGMTMPEEDFVAWAKENGIEIPAGQESRFTDMVVTKLADNGVSRVNPIAPRIDTPEAPNSTLSASRAGPPSNPGLFNAAADPAPTTEQEVALDLTPKNDATMQMGVAS